MTESSLNAEEGLGVASLSVLFAALTLSSMFLPPIIIKMLGCKWTIAVSMCCYITYSLGNFYASWYTLIPTSVILGLGGAPLWSAKCTYLTIAGTSYAEKAEKNAKDIINQYFGIFFLVFQTSGIWGNLISSLILSQSSNQGEISEEDLECCGAYDCLTDANNSTGSERPSDSLIYTLVGVYTASGVLAVLLVIIFLDQIKSDQTETEKEKLEASSFWSTFLATFRHLKDKRQCLLIPLTMYSGFEQAFLAGDYSKSLYKCKSATFHIFYFDNLYGKKSFITCVLGIHYVGYMMICFAGINSLCSLLFGKISQFTGRKLLFALALYGILFEKNKEAAFANYHLWESVGFVIAFAYSTKFQVYIKTYIVLSVLVLSMVTYGAVEYLEAKSSPGTPATAKKENGGPHSQETHM
ncbi:Protein unc-93 A [Lonchura striata]|uniref:Protein unc-93 homolog A n=1 Tax=Lonchura striata TaxID=40157 RepID=A0A218V5M3_9PASE|nr:Protein unc-93 A [Lonchura striata domestica]